MIEGISSLNTKFLDPTLAIISELYSGSGKFKILNDYYKKDTVEFNKLKVGFEIVISRALFDKRDKLDTGISLAKLNKKKIIINDVSFFNWTLESTTGKINSFSTPHFEVDMKRYLRLAIKVKGNYSFIFHIKEGTFITETHLVRGLVHVKVNNIGIDVFLHKKKGHEAYLYFDSTKRVNLKEFNDACFSISIALGLITGAMYLDEGIYFQFSNKGMKEPIGFKYSKFRPTMKPFYTPIHTNPYAFGIAQNEAINWRERLQELEENGFSKLCEKIHNSGKLSSIILLSLESISGSLLLAPSGLSVVLEGLTEIFSSENEDKLNPIKSKTLAGKIKRDLLEVLEKHTEELSSEDKSAKNILKNKISNINSPTNKDKLLKPFEILDIPINDEDKNVINFRNDFLHGRITATEENDDENLEKENIRLYYITLRLYTLISALILKSIGYSGYILNLPKIHLKERKNLDEEYFRKI